ncbi:MAG TPA: phytanoyl-CoA dioxygenase family protein [Acidimicrobiia bacterium]|nr:phytanoyl-CoA dioxygenase family protein [Acidimicrobiia bacterium]
MESTLALTHVPATADGERIATVMAEEGAVVIDELASPEVVDRILAEVDPYLATTEFGPDEFSGRNTRRTGALIARAPASRDLIAHPLVLDVVGRVLAHATTFQLHLTQMIAIGPGEPAQMPHRDQWAYDFFSFPPGFEVQVSTMWAMTDFTEANGATRVVPGSHRAPDRFRYTHDDTIGAAMPRGSVLLYTGSVYHGGGANQSDAVRVGMNVDYNVGWLRQEENQYLAVPIEVARTLPESMQRLIGYARGAYALGYVGDMRDPIEVLRPDAGHTGFGTASKP